MRDFILRPVEDKDLSRIVKIWSASFGDDEKFILALIKSCGLLSTGVCAEMDSAARSFMFAFDDLRIGGKKASYIYALCTEVSFRGIGIGRAVTAYAAQQAALRGAEIVFLFPADGSLEQWYSTALGAVPFGKSAFEATEASPVFSSGLREISPGEYLSLRSDSPWKVPLSLLKAQDAVHRCWGGGFFSLDKSLVSAEVRGERLYIREALGDDKETAIAAVAHKFGCRKLCLLSKSGTGRPLMFIPPFLPDNAEISCPMPFTLD